MRDQHHERDHGGGLTEEGAVRRDIPVDRLFRALPDIPELRVLREAVLASSVPDPARGWSNSSAYATCDKRVLPSERVATALERAAGATRARLERIMSGAVRLLEAAADGDDAALAAGLLELGEGAAAEGRLAEAASCFELAIRVAEALPDRTPVVRATHRLARTLWQQGDLDGAHRLFARSLDEATALRDRRARVSAVLGLGHVRSFQGRWADAGEHYRAALDLTTEEDPLLRAQLFMNLSMVAREQGALDEAREWLDRSEPLLTALDSPADRSVWWNNQGLLYLARGKPEQAEAAFHHALDQAPNDFDRAMVLDNLAEAAIARGLLAEAEAAARRAEEFALAVPSPRALAEVYTRLGKVCRLRGDANGLAFFEKALEICRERRYPLAQATAHLEYGLFRLRLGDVEEARAHLERARSIYRELGAGAGIQRVDRELDALPDSPLAAGG